PSGIQNELHRGALELLRRTNSSILNVFTGHQGARFHDVSLLFGANTIASARVTVKHLSTGRWTVLDRLFDVRGIIDKLEFQQSGLTDDLLRTLGILNPRKLDNNIFLAFPLNNRLAHAELVDSVANRLQRLIDGIITQRANFFLT